MTKGSYYSEFGYYISQIAQTLDRHGDLLFQKELGISLRQFRLLRLFENGKIQTSQQAIAEQLGITKGAVSRHIGIAEKKGWLEVEADPLSRRQNLLSLTRTGKKILSAGKKLIERSEMQGFADITEEDRAATLGTLKTIYTKLNG